MSNRLGVPIVGAAIAACAGVASAGTVPVLTFTYSDLDGAYDGGTSFTATSSAASAGDVTRLIDPTGTATFDTGFADFGLTLSVEGNDGDSATGTGGFVITDIDGDEITGDINGSWSTVGGFIFFTGLLDNVFITSDDGFFDGSFNSIDANFDGQPLNGAIVQLTFNIGGFFQDGVPFADANTETSGQILPAPGAVALLGIGGLAAIRRRR